jgi:hypothetical protein
MTDALHEHELRVLQKVAADLSGDGYRVLIQPEASDLPDFLRPFRPDLVAFRGNGGMVIEVKSWPTSDASKQLGLIAEVVGQRSGWKFEILWVHPNGDAETAEMRLASFDEIRARLPGIKTLYERGEQTAALLVLWSLLEAAARRRLLEADESPRGQQAPTALIKDLVSFGFIDQTEYPRMQQIAAVRNSIAHGLVVDGIDRAMFDMLIEIVERLLEQPAPARVAS